MAKNALIKHLYLDDGRYIENNKIKYRISEDKESEYISWEELWADVKNDIEKIQKMVVGQKLFR